MLRQEIVKTGEGEKVRLRDDEHSEQGCIVLEREDQAVKNKIAKCSARWSMAVCRGDKEEVLRWSDEWGELSCKLFRFWVRSGCPKLPQD